MSHEQLKPFKCPECGVMLSAEWILKRHRETKHSGVKPYVCFQCNVSFTSKDHLHRHLNTRKHVPFVCDECKKVFQRISAFQNHRCANKSSLDDCRLVKTDLEVDMLDSTLSSSIQTDCLSMKFDYLLEENFDKDLINTLDNTLDNTLNNTLNNTSVNTLENSFNNTPDNTLNNVLTNTLDITLNLAQINNSELVNTSSHTQVQVDKELGFPSFLRDSSTEPEEPESKDPKLQAEKWKCPYGDCQKTYSTRFNLRTHIRTAHEKLGFTCEYCKVILMHNHTLQKHLLVCQKKYIKIST